MDIEKTSFHAKNRNIETGLIEPNRGSFRIFDTHSVAKISQKLKGDPLRTSKNFEKSHKTKKIERGPFNLVRFCMLCLIKTKREGDPLHQLRCVFAGQTCLVQQCSRGLTATATSATATATFS